MDIGGLRHSSSTDVAGVVVTGAAYVMETEEHYGRIPVFLKPFDPDALLSYLECVFAF